MLRIARVAATTKVTFIELPKESNLHQAAAVLAAAVEVLAVVVAQVSAAVLLREAVQAVGGS